MPGESSHQAGLRLFAGGQYGAALGEFARAIREGETRERWNDWASAELGCGREVRAEWGYRRALHFDPAYRHAAVNLAVLLIRRGRLQEALPFLTPHAPSLSKSEKTVIANFVIGSGGHVGSTTRPTAANQDLLLDAFLTLISLIPNDDPAMPADLRETNRRRLFDSEQYVKECNELFNALPAGAQPGAIRKLLERANRDPRSALVVATHCLVINEPQAAKNLALAVLEVRPYDLHAQRMLVRADVASTPEKSRAQHPRTGLEEYLAESFCAEPWSHFRVEADGNVYLCGSGWLVSPIGNVFQNSATEMWNSPAAQAIRESILDGSFKYCGRVHCARIACRTLHKRETVTKHGVRSFPCIFLAPLGASEDPVPSNPQPLDLAAAFPVVCSKGPLDIVLGLDATCNLACPQCRRDFYHASREVRERLDRYVQDFLSSELLKNAQSLRVNDSGEVFFSKSYRTLLKQLKKEQYPNLTLAIITNGQLCNRKAFDDLELWRRLSYVEVSVDAAKEETYRVVRRGGDFKRLLANLEFLDKIRQEEGEKFPLVLAFVVCALNFREIPGFVELAQRFHAFASFTFLRNHYVFPPGVFEKLDLSNPGHPEYAEFLRVLEAVPLSDPCIGWGSLGHLRSRPRIERAERDAA
jgi:MoaA/NifB/PqqE/SkfB family radical SAM enzyme